VQKSLSKDFIKRVQNSGGDLFAAENANCCDQIALFLLGKDAKTLQKVGALQAENIFALLLKRFTQRQGYYAYQGKVIDPSFFDKYPFSLKIPDTYRLYSNDSAGRFLSFIYRARMENREVPDNIYLFTMNLCPKIKLTLLGDFQTPRDWAEIFRRRLNSIKEIVRKEHIQV
jgi:hypothetical protein